MPNLPGSTINHLQQVLNHPDLSGTKYQLVRRLGSGGMGEVFLVEDRSLDRRVALKVVHPHLSTKHLADRLHTEAQIIARLEHPGIVPIHDIGTLADGRLFYTMKYVHGRRLDEFVRSIPPLSDILRVFQRICEAVGFAHSNGVIHRDLKPENIMVGSFGEVLVMDWGIAKILSHEHRESDAARDRPLNAPSSPHTLAGTILGTLAYMSPEQASGEESRIGPETDIYSLGAILYFILTGRPPFDQPPSDSPPVERAKPVSPRRLDPRIPRPIEAVALKAMAPSIEQRYKNTQELIADISLFLDGTPVSAYRESPLESLDRWVSRNRFLLLLVITYIIARIFIFFFANR